MLISVMLIKKMYFHISAKKSRTNFESSSAKMFIHNELFNRWKGMVEL